MKRPQRAVSAIAALALLTLLAAPTAASPAGRIVIHGTYSGSHLQLTTRGSKIVVRGHMAGTRPAGCRFTRMREVAVCPLAGAAAIELDMGRRGTWSKCSTACRFH